MTYPESHIDTIRNAIKQDPDAGPEVKEAVEAGLFLLAAFLVDMRRIADALSAVAENARDATDMYRRS